MHRLDHQNLDLIIAQKMPESGMGLAINDKLERAATS
jgi:L-threonylcarbamoyladenylate synthase